MKKTVLLLSSVLALTLFFNTAQAFEWTCHDFKDSEGKLLSASELEVRGIKKPGSWRTFDYVEFGSFPDLVKRAGRAFLRRHDLKLQYFTDRGGQISELKTSTVTGQPQGFLVTMTEFAGGSQEEGAISGAIYKWTGRRLVRMVDIEDGKVVDCVKGDSSLGPAEEKSKQIACGIFGKGCVTSLLTANCHKSETAKYVICRVFVTQAENVRLNVMFDSDLRFMLAERD